MAHAHEHQTHRRVQAATPTLSLLRLSAGQRLGAVAAVLAVLWLAIALVLI